MRRVVWVEYVSVDGVVEDPMWTMPFWSEEQAEMQSDQLFKSDVLLLGRVTYEGFAQSWPSRSGDPFTDRINSMPKHVASKTLRSAEWNATVITGDVGDEVAKLKDQPGEDILIYGSGNLVSTLARNDLIDEYRLMIYPTVVGKGKRLFDDGIDPKAVKLADTKTFASGVVVLFYEPVR